MSQIGNKASSHYQRPPGVTGINIQIVLQYILAISMHLFQTIFINSFTMLHQQICLIINMNMLNKGAYDQIFKYLRE